MARQGPAVPKLSNIQNIYRVKESVPKVDSGPSKSTPKSKKWSLLRRITDICTCGHKTQPPERGGQYEICTEYVKHGVQNYRSKPKANQMSKWGTNWYVKICIEIIYMYFMQTKSCKRLRTWSPLRRWRHTQHNTRRFQISVHPRT